MDENIDERVDIDQLEDFFDEIEIGYYITNSILGDDLEDGYVCVYIKNNDDGEVENILKKLRFTKIKNDFYYQTWSAFSDIRESELTEIKLYYASRMSQVLKKNKKILYFEILKVKWESIRKEINKINLYCLRDERFQCEFFSSTMQSIELALKLPNIQVTNEKTLKNFCLDLYKFIKETINYKKIKEVTGKDWKGYFEIDVDHYFIDIINDIRHLKCHNEPGKIEKSFNNVSKRLKQFGVKNPKNMYEYFVLQEGILNELLGFLKNIYIIITTKEYEIDEDNS